MCVTCGTRVSAFIVLMSALSLLLASGTALAGPPYTTDNPQTVPFKTLQVIAVANVNTAHGSMTAQLPYVELNYGYTRDLQLHVSIPIAYNSPRVGADFIGPGDLDFAAKYRFVQETSKTPMVGIYPHINLPTGNAQHGLGADHVQLYLPLWLQKSFGSWKVDAGGGYYLNPGEKNRDYWLTGALVQHDLNRCLTLGSELFYQSAAKVGGKHQLDFRVGADYHPDANHHYLLSVGRSISGDNDLLFTAGIIVYFPHYH